MRLDASIGGGDFGIEVRSRRVHGVDRDLTGAETPVIWLLEFEIRLDVCRVFFLGDLVVGTTVRERARGRVVFAFGGRRTTLEVARHRFGDDFFIFFLRLAVFVEYRLGEALADDPRADQLAVHVD